MEVPRVVLVICSQPFSLTADSMHILRGEVNLWCTHQWRDAKGSGCKQFVVFKNSISYITEGIPTKEIALDYSKVERKKLIFWCARYLNGKTTIRNETYTSPH